jgi:hypothetical protein
LFALIATAHGAHFISLLISSLDFCQPSNDITGRKLSVRLSGGNIDYSGINRIIIMGNTTDGYGSETMIFSENGTQETTRYFTSIIDIIASITPVDPLIDAGTIDIREASPINVSENNGDYAEILLSVQEQVGINGIATGTTLQDGYSRFGAEDIGKRINITSPVGAAGTYTIIDVLLDPSGEIKDSDTVDLDTTFSSTYSSVEWKMFNTSYSDNGFANGLITLEIANSGGEPFLIKSCWYEVDLPTFLTVPLGKIPNRLYIGSDSLSLYPANAVIDEMRILDTLSNDTGRGEETPSSGRSITTDAQAFEEFSDTVQTLGLFHFNGDVVNYSTFMSSYEKIFRQSENSVNSNFGQSIVFNQKQALSYDNKSIFQNDEGTIEFWVSPILNTYNDPTKRFYVDIASEQTGEGNVIGLTVILPERARSISKITVPNSDTNYYIGGSLNSSGTIATLGQPVNVKTVEVTYVPITSSGDRFSIYKNEQGQIVLYVSASGTEYQITHSVYWEKNSWHRVFVGWDLNNSDNQDSLIMIIDGVEAGTIRYGTGLIYGTGVVYGQTTVWGSASVGTTASRGILSDINLLDIFNTINIGADFTGQFPAMARMDNIRFSSELRAITYLGGEGPGQLIGQDLLYTPNLTGAFPVIEDAITRLLLDFDTTTATIDNIATVYDN